MFQHVETVASEDIRLIMVDKTFKRALVFVSGDILGRIYSTDYYVSMVETIFDEANSDFYVLRKVLTHDKP